MGGHVFRRVVGNAGRMGQGYFAALLGAALAVLGAFIAFKALAVETEDGGVASALNRGLQEARRRGARFALLLDHDSIPTAGMVSALVEG